jgi:hypothetical protein
LLLGGTHETSSEGRARKTGRYARRVRGVTVRTIWVAPHAYGVSRSVKNLPPLDLLFDASPPVGEDSAAQGAQVADWVTLATFGRNLVARKMCSMTPESESTVTLEPLSTPTPNLAPLFRRFEENRLVAVDVDVTVRYRWTRDPAPEARLAWDRLFPEPALIHRWDHTTSEDGLSELVRIPAMETRREPELLLVVDKRFYDSTLARKLVYAKRGDLYTARHQRVADLVASEHLGEFYSAQGIRRGYLDLRYDSLVVRSTDEQKLHAEERHTVAQHELTGVIKGVEGKARGELTEDQVTAHLLQTKGKVIDSGALLSGR